MKQEKLLEELKEKIKDYIERVAVVPWYVLEDEWLPLLEEIQRSGESNQASNSSRKDPESLTAGNCFIVF